MHEPAGTGPVVPRGPRGVIRGQFVVIGAQPAPSTRPPLRDPQALRLDAVPEGHDAGGNPGVIQ